MEKIAEKLREIITREGQDYLEDYPWDVYKELKEDKLGKKEILAVVLMTLVIGIPSVARKIQDPKKLCAQIQKKTGLGKPMADQLSEMYCQLFSAENEEAWADKNEAGLRAFLEKEWEFEWKGYQNWEYGGGYLPCRYEAKMVLQVTEDGIKDDVFYAMIRKNPYMTEDQIAEYFQAELQKKLNDEFEEYVTGDDYYEPVVEDFEAEEYTDDWAKEHGFELLSFEGDGETGDYEQRGHHWF